MFGESLVWGIEDGVQDGFGFWLDFRIIVLFAGGIQMSFG